MSRVKANEKRDRLIESANKLIYEQTFHITTLANIAKEADVPLGNVYYYFKTKEAIGSAVIEKRGTEWAERLAAWNETSDPLARLVFMLKYGLEDLEMTAHYGCPIGGLCQELGKQGGPLSDLAAKLVHDVLQWSEEQFKALGFHDKASDLALNLISSMQGVYLLTHTFKDPKLTIRQTDELQSWLEGLAERQSEITAEEMHEAMA